MVSAAPRTHTSHTGRASMWMLLAVGLLLAFLFTLDLGGGGVDPVADPGAAGGVPAPSRAAEALLGAGEAGPSVATGSGTEESANREEAPQGEVRGVLCAGRVVESRNNRPVAGARVVLARGEKSSQAETDEEGRFTVFWSEAEDGGGDATQDLGAGAPRLEVVAAGFLTLRRTPFDPGDPANGDAAYALTRSGRITGRLLSADEVAGTEVILWYGGRQEVGAEVDRTVVGEQGRFELGGVAPGLYAVGARVPGSGLLVEPGVLVMEGEEKHLDLLALPGGAIRGRVTRGREREPVAGASVLRTPSMSGVGDVAEEAGEDETETDDDGRFLFEGVGVGGHVLLARAPWGNEEREWVRLEESGGQVEVELVVSSAGSLSGSVVEEGYSPVVGAKVLLLSEKAGEVSSLLSFSEDPLQDGKVVVTDSFGRFRFDDLRSQLRFTPVVLGGDGETRLMGETLRLGAGEEREGLVLLLRRQVTLWGRVTDAAQAPLAGAQVTVEFSGRGWRHPHRSTLTDGDGAFRLERVPHDSGSLRVEATGHTTARERVQVAPDEDRVEVNVVMEKSSSLRGIVVDGEGNSLDHGWVILEWNRSGSRERWNRSSKIDGWGRFEFQDPGLGACKLRVDAIGWEQEQETLVEILAGQDAFLTIPMAVAPYRERASLRGRAVIVGHTAPVESLWLRGLRGGTLVVDGGEFTVRGMAPGEAQLTLGGLGTQRFTTEVIQLSPGVETDLGTLAFPPGTELRVRVVDEGGGGIYRPKVQLRPLGEKGSDPPRKSDRRKKEASSGRHYERKFWGLGQGRWELEASAKGYLPAKVILRTHQAKQTRVVTLVKAR